MKVRHTSIDSISETRAFLKSDFPDFFVFDLNGTDQDDILVTPASSDYVVDAGAGNDVVRIKDGSETALNGVIAGTGSDYVYGASGQDYVLAGGGADRINAHGSDDRIFGQGGDDLIIGGNGDDLLNGGAGNDRLLGDRGNDRLFGGSGYDMLRGGKGTNLLAGGSGGDSYILLGRDTVTDRGGNDTYAIALDAKVTINDFGGLDDLQIAQQIETLTFERHDNSLLISGLKDGGSVDIEKFFQTEHAIDFLHTSETFYQMYFLHDLKDGESVNGGDVWGFVS